MEKRKRLSLLDIVLLGSVAGLGSVIIYDGGKNSATKFFCNNPGIERKVEEDSEDFRFRCVLKGRDNDVENRMENDVERKENVENEIYADYTSRFEGRRGRVYDARPNDPGVYERTIGIGHFLDRGDSRETFREIFGDEVNYDAVYFGRETLSNDQIDRLFEHDIEEYVERARRIINGFDDLPDYLRQALVDMSYRGDLGGSPNARKFMNSGSWKEAGDEYINSREYRNSNSNGMGGIRTRMDSNRERILRYDGELER